jgi:hypothetical protein
VSEPSLTSAELVEVRLLGLDLPDYEHSERHHAELFREFALLSFREAEEGGGSAPKRLLALVDELNARFSEFTEATQRQLVEALARGDDCIDLVFRVPRDVRDAVVRFRQLLDDADEYCRRGDLLTLAPPPRAIAFRDWYLDEFVRQIDGQPPLPWPEARPE